MRVHFINFYSTLNKGDAGILLSQIQAIRTLFPDAQITVQSWTPEADREWLDVTVVGPFFEGVSDNHPEWGRLRRLAHTVGIGIRTLASAVAFRFRGRGRQSATTESPDPMAAYRAADVIVSVGGGYLYSYRGLNWFPLCKHLHQLAIALLMGKPVVVLAQSIGPVDSPLLRRLLSVLLKRASAVCVREQRSYDFLKSWNVRMSRVSITPDSAFLLKPASACEADKILRLPAGKDGQLKVGMTVRRWNFPGSADPDAKAAQVTAAFVSLIDWLAETHGAHVFLFPQCICPEMDDRIYSREIASQVGRQEAVSVMEDSFSAPLLKALYGRMDIYAGTRMHSNIFAMAMGVPTVSISYQPKSEGIMEMVNQGRYSLKIGEVTADTLRGAVSDLLAERESISEDLCRTIPSIQASAMADIRSVISRAAASSPAGQ
jgi:colanic acid/amylovoran biosynthesis protein